MSFDGAGKTADAIRDAKVDAGFIASEAERASVIEFSSAYVELPATYLVPAGLAAAHARGRRPPRRAHRRQRRSAYDLYLTRTLKHAELVRAESIPASFKLFIDQKLDALAGLKPGLLEDVRKVPGARLLEGQFTAVQQSIGVPKKRAAAVRHLRAFVEEVKGSGVVARLIEKHGVKGVNVAPPAR